MVISEPYTASRGQVQTVAFVLKSYRAGVEHSDLWIEKHA